MAMATGVRTLVEAPTYADGLANGIPARSVGGPEISELDAAIRCGHHGQEDHAAGTEAGDEVCDIAEAKGDQAMRQWGQCRVHGIPVRDLAEFVESRLGLHPISSISTDREPRKSGS